MSSHVDEETPLEEEQIVIPVLSEEEVKLENDNHESYENQEIGGHHGEEGDVRDINIGSEVQLEERNNENFDTEEIQRQMFTSQDDYELVSSKQSSHASMNNDNEKTPTPPPEIVLPASPTPSPPPSPVTTGNPISSATIIVEGFDGPNSIEMEDAKIIQQRNPSFFQTMLNGLSVLAEWIRWLFMDNKWGDIFTHKQEI